MKVNAILACDLKFGIGHKGDLPWPHNSTDLKWFKNQTNGGAVLMGRTTWESIGSKSLPNRTNIVITNKNLKGPDFVLSGTMDQIIQEAVSRVSDCDLWIMGGADVYEQAFPYCDKLYLTKFNDEFECDKYISSDIFSMFPSINMEINSEEELTFQVRSKMKNLESITDHNERVTKPRNYHTGIECPVCKTELAFVDPDVISTLDPPKQVVKCYNCGFSTDVYV